MIENRAHIAPRSAHSRSCAAASLAPRLAGAAANPKAASRATAARRGGLGRVLEESPSFQAAFERERSQVRDELFAAAQVQRELGAPRRLRRGPFDIAGEIFPLRCVSGDFLAVFDVGARTILAVGDISGKGLAAGMWFTHLVGLVRIFAGTMEEMAAVAGAINRHLVGLQPKPPLATVFLARLDSGAGEFTYCNAGHPAPALLRADGSVEWLRAGGPVLGALPGAVFTTGRAALDPGDTLLSYTDGVVECRNRGDEEFGVERLLAAARAADGNSAGAKLFSVLGAAQDFAASRPPADDLALMVVHHLAHGR